MSSVSSVRTLPSSEASFSSSSFVSIAARGAGSDVDSLAHAPLLATSAEEASFMAPAATPPSMTSTKVVMSPSASSALTWGAGSRPAPLRLHLSRPARADVLEGSCDARLAARYQRRAAELFDRLADLAQTEDTLAAQDVRAFLHERGIHLAQDALIAVLPQLYIGHDGFYVAAGPYGPQGTSRQAWHAHALLQLGLIEDVELVCARVQAKLDEIHQHLLREGGTDRLVHAASVRGVRVARTPWWARPQAQLPWRLAQAGVVGSVAGLALAPLAGALIASAGAWATMHACFWPQHHAAQQRDAVHRTHQSQAWLALLRAERWSAGQSLASLRSTPEL